MIQGQPSKKPTAKYMDSEARIMSEHSLELIAEEDEMAQKDLFETNSHLIGHSTFSLFPDLYFKISEFEHKLLCECLDASK